MSARWYYKAGDGEIGPVDVAEVERLIKSGRLGPEDPVRDENSDLFRAVRRVPRFATVLPKAVVKTRLEAAEVEEVKRNPNLKHRANLKGTKNAIEAAERVARDVEAGKYEVDEKEHKSVWRRREFIVTTLAVTTLLFAGAGYVGYTTLRRVANRQAFDLTVDWVERAEAAVELGLTSAEFRKVVDDTDARVEAILEKASEGPTLGPGPYIREAASQLGPAVRSLMNGQEPDEAFSDVKGTLVTAGLAFEGKLKSTRDL